MTHLAILTTSPLRSAHWSDDAPVIQGRRVADGYQVPTFSEMRWNLRGAIHRTNAKRSDGILDFSRFADPVRRLTAKELVMQRLNRPVSVAGRRKSVIKPGTAAATLRYLSGLYDFMDARGVKTLAALTQDHLNAYLREVAASTDSPAYQAYKLNVVVWLYEARDLLSHDSIAFMPWGGRSPASLIGVTTPKENKTPRIPEETMGPLLRWSLAYVDRFSADILAACRVLRGPRVPPFDVPKAPAGESRRRLKAWIEECRRDGMLLPRHPFEHDKPNLREIARRANVRVGASSKHADLLVAAANELGLEPAVIARPSNLQETGCQWRPDFNTYLDVYGECRRLVAACYVVSAYLSGMRDSEVQTLRRGAYRPTRDVQGEIIRHKVAGVEFKGKRADGGVPRTWVVIEPVAKAIAVMEDLTAVLSAEGGSDLLFVQLWGDAQNPALKGQVNRYLEKFIETVNAEIQPRLADIGLPPIPMGTASDPLRITTRMFRRTVAWHIANRPFGVVAGMLQYGHAAEVTFEGYAGSSASGFRAEVEAERETARRMDILDMYEDHKRGVRPAGPMAEELDGEFRAIREELGDFPGKVVDERRREKMLEHLRVRLHPGLMADCFFEAKEASCLRHLAEKERVAPVAWICDPRCPNACWLKKHLAVWEGALADVRRLGKRNRISSIQRDILRDKAKDYEAIIKDIREASYGGQQEER